MTYHGTGYGKLLLFGEHAAVYGYPALGVALPDATRVTLTPGGDARWSAPGIPAAYQPYIDDVLALLERELQTSRPGLQINQLRGRIGISSTIPVAQGYGSSASLCVAMAHAALQAADAIEAAGSTGASPAHQASPAYRQSVWMLANRLERLFHGRPSGIDTGLALQPEVTAFHFVGSELPRAQPVRGGSLVLVAGALPRSGSTRELIAAIGERMRANDGRTAAALAELGELTSEAIGLLPNIRNSTGITRLGALADRAHRALTRLGLETPNLRRCLRISRECGSAGGKLSGAGGGGAFFALFHQQDNAVHAARELVARQAVNGAAVRVIVIADGRSRAIGYNGTATARTPEG